MAFILLIVIYFFSCILKNNFSQGSNKVFLSIFLNIWNFYKMIIDLGSMDPNIPKLSTCL